MEGETTEIDENWFDIEDHRKAENAVTAARFDIFEGRLLNFTKYSSFRVIFNLTKSAIFSCR